MKVFFLLTILSLSQAFRAPLLSSRRRTLSFSHRSPHRLSYSPLTTSNPQEADQQHHDADEDDDPSWWERIAMVFSQSLAFNKAKPGKIRNFTKFQFWTFLRVSIPSLLAGVVSALLFPAMALTIASGWAGAGGASVVCRDSSQVVRNCLTVAGLLFSILVGQTCAFWFKSFSNRFIFLTTSTTQQITSCTRNKRVCITHCFKKLQKQNHCSNRSPWFVKDDPCTESASKALASTCKRISGKSSPIRLSCYRHDLSMIRSKVSCT